VFTVVVVVVVVVVVIYFVVDSVRNILDTPSYLVIITIIISITRLNFKDPQK
jgi:hypothetical protein